MDSQHLLSTNNGGMRNRGAAGAGEGVGGMEVEMFNPDQLSPEFLPHQATGPIAPQPCSPKRAAFSLLAGVVFGFGLHQTGVYRPDVIVQQMQLESFLMLKVFLGAAGLSMLAFSMAYFVAPIQFRTVRSGYFPTDDEGSGVLAWPGVVVGAMLLGSGMAVGGSCPGTVWAQLGAGIPNALYTFLGAVLSSLVFVFVAPSLDPLRQAERLKIRRQTADTLLKVSFPVVAMPLGMLMLGISVALDYIAHSWEEETNLPQDGTRGWTVISQYWHPLVGASFIALAEFACIVGPVETLGGSTAFAVCGCQAANAVSGGRLGGVKGAQPFLQLEKVWQVFLVMGVALGSCAAAALSGQLGTVAGLVWWRQLLGGVMIAFGARTAGGCTSGHGISGMGQLITNSFLAVPSMLAGGFATGLIWKALS